MTTSSEHTAGDKDKSQTTPAEPTPSTSCSEPTIAKKAKIPKEFFNGDWEVEPHYYSSASSYGAAMSRNGSSLSYLNEEVNKHESSPPLDKTSKRGLVYKSRNDQEYKCFQDEEGVSYRLGEHVFIETLQPAEPYLIGSIMMFKMTKRSDLLVKVSRYYRPDDVPELSYSLIVQERKDLGQEVTRQLRSRELFSSEACVLHPISSLRGKCKVKLVKDIRSVCASSSLTVVSQSSSSNCGGGQAVGIAAVAEEELLSEDDSFFTYLNFNQESSRLASVQGEIRVGVSFQAKLPPCSSSCLSDESDRDELLYRPGFVCAETEQNYIKLARTFRTFSLMNNKKITMLEKAARSGDLLFDDSVVTLHRCGYNVVEATKMMQANDQHLASDSSFMSADDVKKFGKGIKTYGKNFAKISKELIPLHQRDQLVGFYYLWKKSRDATRPKPLRKNAVGAVGRRAGKPNGLNGVSMPRNASSKTVLATLSTADIELLDYASASETETEQMDGERACHHCYTSKSKDWHHAGRERQLMCTQCRLFYKKYGQLRPVDRPATVPPCLFKSARQSPTDGMEEQENDEPTGVRTRGAGRKERRRTPSSLEAYGLEMRTPIKSELFVENGGNSLERRTTPQRSAKINRKRAHRGSNSTLFDEYSPLVKTKRPKNMASRTPSPLTTSKPSSSEKNNKASSSSDNSPQTPSNTTTPALITPKKEEAELEPMPVNSPTKAVKVESNKKPIAKVEPLDPNESTNRTSSPVLSEAYPTKPSSPDTKTKEKPKVEEKADCQKTSTSASPETTIKQELVEEGDENEKEKEDDCPIGHIVDLEVQALLNPAKTVFANLRRRLNRSSGVSCSRTDITYVDTDCSKWSQAKAKKLEAKQKEDAQALHQQKLSLALNQQNQQALAHQQMLANGRKQSEVGQHGMEQMNLAMGGRVPMNGSNFPPAMAAAAMIAQAQMDPRIMAAFGGPQQLQMMMAQAQGLEQQQKMEHMQRHQQQQQRQQLNGSIGSGTPNSHANKMLNPSAATSMTPHVTSPMDPQRNTHAFMSPFSQQQQQQPTLMDTQQQQAVAQQQQSSMASAFGIAGSTGDMSASQALQTMMGERTAALEQQQRNSIIERIHMEYINQQQQHQQQQQNQAAAALAAAASHAQQQQQQQQALLMAAAGHPSLVGADPMQVQMFLSIIQQQQQQQQHLAMQQQQQQAAAAAAQRAAQQQAAVQEQQAAAAQQQQQQQFFAAAMNLSPHMQHQMNQLLQHQQMNELMRRFQQESGAPGGGRNT